MTINNLTEADIEQLKKISHNIKTQDNLATNEPSYIVYQLKEVVIDGEYITPGTRNDEFQESWTMYRVNDDSWLREEELDEYYENNEEEKPDLEDLEQAEFSYVDDFVQCFFTREAAQTHIDQNYYHYTKPYIYVESFWRNPECQLIRKILANLEF
jgi:hypothetical protein